MGAGRLYLAGGFSARLALNYFSIYFVSTVAGNALRETDAGAALNGLYAQKPARTTLTAIFAVSCHLLPQKIHEKSVYFR
jgi:hypothetical protein